MAREVFIIKNISSSEIELKDFGLVLPSGVTVDLTDFDRATISDELYNYFIIGDLKSGEDGYKIPMNDMYEFELDNENNDRILPQKGKIKGVNFKK
jgi:hypothetical protein